MEELALHILDVAENSVRAGARRVEIRVHEDPAEDRLRLEIADDGCGMSEEVARRAADPFFTTRRDRQVGLGLALLEQAARAAGGCLRIESAPGAGTRVTAEFRYGHPDRQPLGDIAATLLALAAGHPETEFLYEHCTPGSVTRFGTAELRQELGTVPLNSAAGIRLLRQRLEKALGAAQAAQGGEVRHGAGHD
ncbi:MAG: ATP-binding protein [Bryobacterales bacterium]|nr:ATP-binding protein [Bryobacteraceae bacterium]MDW8129501.1 ATP-binding protein [Bryobacterales bacterium]